MESEDQCTYTFPFCHSFPLVNLRAPPPIFLFFETDWIVPFFHSSTPDSCNFLLSSASRHQVNACSASLPSLRSLQRSLGRMVKGPEYFFFFSLSAVFSGYGSYLSATFLHALLSTFGTLFKIPPLLPQFTMSIRVRPALTPLPPESGLRGFFPPVMDRLGPQHSYLIKYTGGSLFHQFYDLF